MTVKEAGEGIIIEEETTYLIDFVNSDKEDDQTELTATGIDDLKDLYNTFCMENGFENNTVTYIMLSEEIMIDIKLKKW